jgi:hypothetical protein
MTLIYAPKFIAVAARMYVCEGKRATRFYEQKSFAKNYVPAMNWDARRVL